MQGNWIRGVYLGKVPPGAGELDRGGKSRESPPLVQGKGKGGVNLGKVPPGAGEVEGGKSRELESPPDIRAQLTTCKFSVSSSQNNVSSKIKIIKIITFYFFEGVIKIHIVLKES